MQGVREVIPADLEWAQIMTASFNYSCGLSISRKYNAQRRMLVVWKLRTFLGIFALRWLAMILIHCDLICSIREKRHSSNMHIKVSCLKSKNLKQAPKRRLPYWKTVFWFVISSPAYSVADSGRKLLTFIDSSMIFRMKVNCRVPTVGLYSERQPNLTLQFGMILPICESRCSHCYLHVGLVSVLLNSRS